jgi:hypothetical protein
VGRLQNAGDHVTVVTNFPALPRGTTSIDVLFPGIAPLVAVGVRSAPEGAFRAGATVATDSSTWSPVRNTPQTGWPLSRWPTPVPVIEPNRFRGTVDRLIR